MLPVTPRPPKAIGRMRFNRRRCNITCSYVPCPSGSPENRTQHYAGISRVWATSPRLPFQVGHPGVEPGPSCSRSRRAPICTSARLFSVRTAGYGHFVTILWSVDFFTLRLRKVKNSRQIRSFGSALRMPSLGTCCRAHTRPPTGFHVWNRPGRRRNVYMFK